MEPFQYWTPCRHGLFGTCLFFIHCSLDHFFIIVRSQIDNWILDRFVTPVEVGINLLGVWIFIFHRVQVDIIVIKGFINCFTILFSWHADFTNILVIEEFSLLLMRVYHTPFVINGVLLFLFICAVVWASRRRVCGEKFCFNMINIFDFFRCKNSSREVWEYPIHS